MLPYAIVTISLALLFYSVGVWFEKIQGQIKRWHLFMFWIGFVFDTTGTTLMMNLSADGFRLDLHGITGLLAIILMLVHVLWATWVVLRNNAKAKKSFHKFSILVWFLWLIPYISGILLGMTQ